MKTRITATDSPEFDLDSTPPAVRVGGDSSLEWATTFQGGFSGRMPRQPR